MPKEYITQSGDIWDLIAHEQMGSAKYLPLLLEANPAYLETVIFSAGKKLTIPDIPQEMEIANLPPWRRAR